MKKKILVFSPSTTYIFTLPALLLNFQRHHEQFGRHPDDWEWCEPVLDFEFDTIEEFTDYVIDSRQPDVLVLGVYVWNEELCLELGRRVKERLPNCKVIIGGPQISFLRDPSWFSQHPYIDYGCHVSGYGELFMTELLDQISEGNLREKDIPLLCKPTADGYELLGEKPNPRDYVWPTKIYDSADERLARWVAHIKDKGLGVGVLLEGTRGCPYSCTYCEWGGGIGAKISAKPTEQVVEELELFAQLKVDKLFVTDANFGILARDVDITKSLVEIHDRTGFPLSVDVMGPAKNNLDRMVEIDTLLLANGLMGNWTLNIQTLDDDVLTNIKRTDIPWRERLVPYTRLAEEYDLDINMQMIFPLPGWSYKHFLEEIDHQAKYNVWGMHRFELQILPNAEMSDPVMLEKYGMVIKPVSMRNVPPFDAGEIDTNNILVADPDRVEVDGTEFGTDLRTKYAGKTHSVISSNDINSKELIDVRWTIPLLKSFQQMGFMSDLTDWLATQGIPHSEYYDKFVTQWLWNKSDSVAKSSILQKSWYDLRDDWMLDPNVAWYRYTFPLADFPFLLEPQHLYVYAWLTDPALLQDWANWVFDEWGPKAGDLAELIRVRTINVEWNPVDGVVHKTGWDWRPWIFQRQEPLKTPVTLRWTQSHFRGQLLPHFQHGDLTTSKLWVLSYMYPINRSTLINRNMQSTLDETFVSLQCEEVCE